ncbi:MAG: hypothetical protein Q8928_06075 [Bacteroidota bacterium]|nr:hypothetical protein [Bacteroidota bacterium]
MKVIENASVVCISKGDSNIVVIMDENTGKTITLQDPKEMVVALGLEGILVYEETQVVSFEPVMEEELA